MVGNDVKCVVDRTDKDGIEGECALCATGKDGGTVTQVAG
jgi:hypothetical protein